MKRLLSIILCAIVLVSLLLAPGHAVTQNNSVMPRAVFQWGPDSFALVGSGLPGIRQWDPADPAGDMEKVDYSYFDYEIVLEVTAGTSMSFKFVGNDQWDEEWTFGGTGLVLGQTTKLVQGAGSPDLKLSVTEDCLLRFTVDFNAYYAGEGNATVLVTKVNPPSFRSLKVDPPYDWSKVYVYSDDSQFLSPSPGSLVPEVSYYHEMMIPVDVCNLVISGITKDGRVFVSDECEPRGEAKENIQLPWLCDKFRYITAPVLTAEGQAKVLEMITGEADMPIRQLVDEVNKAEYWK